MKRTAQERIAHAEAMASQHLGNYNEALSQGNLTKAERLLEKAQHWLDKANDLRGFGDLK